MEKQEITVGRLFEFYLDTLDKCGSHVKNLPDNMIEYYIFEEFVVGATTFFQENSLDKLLHHRIIDDKIYASSKELRARMLELEGTDKWNIISVKNSIEWNSLMQIADQIKQEISERWSEEDICRLISDSIEANEHG